MEFSTYIDQYCERVAPGIWAEPLNFWSNFAFILVACVLYYLRRQQPGFSREQRILLVQIFCVGIGSALFHSVATLGTMVFDILPIACFLLTYIFFATRYLQGIGSRKALLILVAFLLLSALLGLAIPGSWLGGSEYYLGTLVALVLFSRANWGLAAARQPQVKRYYQIAAWLFAAAVLCRSLDQRVCHLVPFGTHFMWHILDAVVAGIAVRAFSLISLERDA